MLYLICAVESPYTIMLTNYTGENEIAEMWLDRIITDLLHFLFKIREDKIKPKSIAYM